MPWGDALGQTGEEMAARHLKKLGYKILDRRWKCRFGELDLVAKKGDEVVFVEVKTRTTHDFGGAAAAVGWHKAERLRAAAYCYLDAKNLHDRPFRIDVVAITTSLSGQTEIEHLPSAVGEEY